MADFGELCPIFSTGVYNEVTFPSIIDISAAAATYNLLENYSQSAGAAVASVSGWSFGRTVVVTGAYLKRHKTNNEAENLHLRHKVSSTAAGTIFATATVTNTISVYQHNALFPMTFSTSKTFTSDEVLGLSVGTLTALTQGDYALIVRFREK